MLSIRVRVGLFVHDLCGNTKNLFCYMYKICISFLLVYLFPKVFKSFAMIWFSLELPVSNKCIKTNRSYFGFNESVNQLQCFVNRDQSLDYVVQIMFVLFVLLLLFVMGGIETNRCPHQLSEDNDDYNITLKVYQRITVDVKCFQLQFPFYFYFLNLIWLLLRTTVYYRSTTFE